MDKLQVLVLGFNSLQNAYFQVLVSHLVTHGLGNKTPTVMQLFGFPLQGHSRRIRFDAAMAATGAVGSVQRHNQVAKLRGTKGASMDQFVLMNDAAADPYGREAHMSA